MHDGFGVAADDAAAAVGGEAVKHGLAVGGAGGGEGVGEGEAGEPAIAVAFLVDGGDFGLDAFGEELEELLCVLVLAGVEEGGGGVGAVGQDGDEVRWPDGGGAGVGVVEAWKYISR